MANAFQAAGSRADHESGWTVLFTNRFFLGLVTNRSPLRSPVGVIYESYYRLGGIDTLIAGTNVEVSNRLTICRRPGNTAGLSTFISSANVPDVPDSFYSFHEIGGTIRVFADTPTAPYLIGGFAGGSGTASQGVIPIFTKAGGIAQSFFQGIGQSLYFSDAKEQQKWLDFGAGNPGNSFSTITFTDLLSNVATIIAVNNFVPGQKVVISGTTNGGGALNVTAVISSANAGQFSFPLVHADIGLAPDTGFANATWNWQISPPLAAPTLNIVASGAAATTWNAATVYSTMGFIVDANGNVQQLISVNALGGNTTQYGTTGTGGPAWNQTPGGTTTDNTITWTNWGPVGVWAAGFTFSNNAPSGGTLVAPALIFDPTTGHLQINGRAGQISGVSGGSYPHFTGVIGSFIFDGTVKWFDIGPPLLWIPSHVYPVYNGNNPELASHGAVEPTLPPSTTQTIFFQSSGGGTSNASGTAPPFATIAGQQANDNQLIWLCLGSATWAASTSYTQWTGTAPVFSVVKDANGNMQVCIVSGTSGSLQPLPTWIANHAYALNFQIVDSNLFVQKVTTNGTSGAVKTLTTTALTSGIATYTTSTNHGYTAGQLVTVTGSTHDATFNVVNAQIVSTPTAATLTVNIPHDNIGSAGDVGTIYAGPTWNSTPGGTTTDGSVTWTNQGAENAGGRPAAWGVNYGDKTPDGTVTWTCVGQSMAWAASTQWHLPTAGFAPPSASQPYGGSEVIGTGFVQAVIQSGKSAAVTQPTWSTTIGNFVLDPSNSNTQITWRCISAQSTNSLAFTKGYGYVFAYKARTVTDLYAPEPAGGGVLLGQSASTPSPLVSQGTTPTGSADGSVSTASPSVQMAVGANAGAVIFISGLGSTDPQVDTISIFRTFDGGATFFWLTDIKNPNPVGGVAQAWTYADFLPDISNNISSGLNTLVLGPINHSNDPPLAGAINLVQYFGRIFYSVGATVYCSQGPNVGGGSQPPGNGYTAFNPGQFFTFPSTVTRMVPTQVGLLVFTTSDLGIVSGGPNITQMFPNIYVPGLGLVSYNALSVRGGLIDLFTADNQVVSLDPNMGINKIGYPIGDQFIKYGAQTTTFSPSNAYVASHTQGLNDEAVFVADGSTGWFRVVSSMAPDAAISGPVWSPKAAIVGGTKAIASLEVAPGQHALLVGATAASHPVLVRDSTYTTFSDNGTAYPANFIFGSMVLANPGQLAELGFITCEFLKLGTSPKLAVMLDEVADSVMVISAASQSAGNTTYTYTLTTGYAVVPGSGVTITGMADSGNNGTFTVNTVGGGTFTVTNANGVTRSVQTGAGTLFEDLSGYVSAVTGLPPQDAPTVYGLQFTPASTFSNRYYLAQSINGVVPPQGVDCRHAQVRIDFGATDTLQNELLTLSIWGRHWQEN